MIIGSTALKFWFPDFPREPKDIDVIGEYIGDRSKRIEYLRNPILEGLGEEYLSPNLLYTLKMSHALGQDIKWEKHVFDIQFLKEKGCVLDMDLFFKLYEYWNNFHRNKRSNLKMTSKDFFNNALKCPWDHDKLHTILKPVPTFNKVLKDGEEVEVSEEKFLLLSKFEKEELVREEVYIMAFERYSDMSYRHAYSKMLKKFVLNHCPIWEGIYILENYKELCNTNFNFIKFLNEKINENTEYFIRGSSRSV